MFWILTLQVRFERKESMSWMKLGFIAGADTEFYLGGGGGQFFSNFAYLPENLFYTKKMYKTSICHSYNNTCI
jgi:hypothetical protein